MENTTPDDRRKHPRFSDRILAGVKVDMLPVPPLYGDPVSGYLTDLSAGGMGIIIPDMIPKNVFLKMKMVLPDGFMLESVVTVRRVIKMGRTNDYLHGFEFLNPSPEMIEHIEAMAAEILACNDRTKAKADEICIETCSLRQICKRPQCVEKNIRPAIIALTASAKPQPAEPLPQPNAHDDWATFKSKFEKFLKAA